jgi:hypothetical protein
MVRRAAAVILLGLAGPARAQPATATPAAIVQAAVRSAGGRAALEAARALDWDATATVHAGGQDVAITGRWRVLPPDSAISTTWLTARGPSTARSLVVSAARGWLVRDTALTPMPPETLAEERHQFYLYALLRLVPLLDPAARLSAAGTDSAGNRGVRVERDGRLPVTLWFDAAPRVVAMTTTFAARGGGPGDRQDIRLEGAVAAGGITWFRRMVIRRAGSPYFEMDISALRTAAGLDNPMLRGERRP